MENLKHTIGYYTSLLFLASTLLFGVCFLGLFILNPPFTWTNLEEYIQYCMTHDQSLKHIAQASMILLSISLLVLIALIHDKTPEEKRFFSRLSLQFGTISSTLLSLGYFVQITAVKWKFEQGQTEGLAHFIQFYPNSSILAIIMLGYTLFLGLCSLSIVPVLQGSKAAKTLRFGFLLNAIACGLGLIGFLFQIIPLILFATNMGNGIALLILGIGMIKYIKAMN